MEASPAPGPVHAVQCCHRSPIAVQLAPFVQHYDWGMPASSSLVAKFAAVAKTRETAAAGDAWDALLTANHAEGLRRRPSTTSESACQRTRPFAELWMGAHHSGPNRVISCFNDPAVVKKTDELAARSFSLSHMELRTDEGAPEGGPRRGVKRGSSGDLRSACLSRWLRGTSGASSECGGGTPDFPLSRRRSLAEAFVGCPLPVFMASSPQFMGGESHLPFLFKILSVQKPLSIQSHPDKHLAEFLHRRRPQHFPDSNHKPELAIAVGPFEALCGFRAVEELVLFIQHTPELKDALGDAFLQASGARALLDQWRQAKQSGAPAVPRTAQHAELLKTLFAKILRLPRDTFTAALAALIDRLHAEGLPPAAASLSEEEQESLRTANAVALRLHAAHGPDPGVFAAFCLNYVHLNSGDGIFIGPNIPHCYLSDNVIRGGLTSKHTDVDLLCSSLRFDIQGTYSRVVPEPVLGDCGAAGSRRQEASDRGHVAVYDPLVEGLSDFQVYKLCVARGQKLDDCGRLLRSAPGLALVFHCPFDTSLTLERGAEKVSLPLHFGQVLFISAGSSLVMQRAAVDESQDENMEAVPSGEADVAEAFDSQLSELLCEEDRDRCIVFLVTFENRTANEATNDLKEPAAALRHETGYRIDCAETPVARYTDPVKEPAFFDSRSVASSKKR
ncbi:hypothetical protein NCLIV_026860 [Neospora caninum Liverpool]|uniref:Phosphomannose isomerase type I catalytic domain-containing protein n=1 Tax=Neospora caninum (strain Liverpool) TaxID=572307 RepID=F0VGQ4_NEOCL|nr:hypothetical protein NCLIV_026860 [Neospora caninum Liverpool]CBZ52898.1 hypothetical protein NCLIV_026860 [Neospora caninum Liverpool]|eukprot:XP_003882930.1 hypothetical protein NCLIV_026860 [Neospora caninum Liverpool]